MAGSTPIRIDEDVAHAAEVAAALFSRSAAEQVNHWARIGRELEASSSVSQRDIADVLAGCASYDLVGAREQAVVRAEWTKRMTALREGLDLAAEFSAAGETWTEPSSDDAAASDLLAPGVGRRGAGQPEPERLGDHRV